MVDTGADMVVDTGAGVVVVIGADTGAGVATGEVTGVVIHITLIMDLLHMEKEIPIIPADMPAEIATTDHLLLEIIVDTVLPPWEDQQHDLMIG